MVVNALRGALGFLSRLPVGRDENAWTAFRATPMAFPLVGYLLGGLLAVPVLVPFPTPVVGLVFVVVVYALTGVNHLDGIADLGDAVAVHGDAARRRDAMTDTAVGVGGVLAVALVVMGLTLAGIGLASLPARAALLVVTGEVSAKLGMAVVAGLGVTTHEGLGASIVERVDVPALVGPTVVALPAAVLTWPNPAAGVALLGGVVASVVVLGWARAALGGVSGDVLGATNEVARLVALHVGLVAWTHW